MRDYERYDDARAKDEERDDHISPTSYLGQAIAKAVTTQAPRTPTLGSTRRYCEMCDKWVPARQTVCRACGAPTVKAAT